MPSDNHHVVKRLIQEWDECERLDQHAQNHDLLGQSWIPFFFFFNFVSINSFLVCS